MSTSKQQDSQERINALLAPMLKQRLFAAFSTAVASVEDMFPHIADHLEYMNDLEAKGLLFASGPFIQPGVIVGDGLTILQTSTLDEARTLMKNEPLIRLGLRKFDLHPWSCAKAGSISPSAYRRVPLVSVVLNHRKAYVT
jgi:uncharacterized protein YciI